MKGNLPRKKTEYCKWEAQESWEQNDVWSTACGEEFTFFDGRPEDNSFKYCPYCGKVIK